MDGYYPQGHPVELALASFLGVLALKNTGGKQLFDCLCSKAEVRRLRYGGPEFDEAAALLDFHYCELWDAYLDRETWLSVRHLN